MDKVMLPDNLIQLFEKDDYVGWAIKDTHSRFLYVNRAFKLWQTLSPRFDYEGLNIKDVPAPVAEFSEIFDRQERLIEQSGKPVRAITTHIQGRERIMQPAYNVQEPLYDAENRCIGTVISVRHVNIVTPTSLLTGKISQHAVFERPSEVFTEKEWEVLYLLICGLRLTEISSVLSVSVDAVNGRLRSCYRKTGLNSAAALIRYCRDLQIDNYIPAFFLKKGHIIIKE